MNQFRRFDILQSPLFVISLATLLLNDWVLKSQFHNWLTGKLSDVAGLALFFLLAYAFYPRYAKRIMFLLATFFIYWKSPISQGLIDSWNQLDYLPIHRVVDTSDLLALPVIPLAWWYAGRCRPCVTRLPFSYLLIFASVFAITGTSTINYTPEELQLLEKIDKVREQRVTSYSFGRNDLDQLTMGRIEKLVYTLPQGEKLEQQGVKFSHYRKDWFEAISYNFETFYINTWVFHGKPNRLTEYYISPLTACDRQLALGQKNVATVLLGAQIKFYRREDEVHMEEIEMELCDIPGRKNTKEAMHYFLDNYIREIEGRFYSDEKKK